MKATALVTILLLSMITTVSAAEIPIEQRRKALEGLLAEQWQYVLSTNPEFASIIGDKRWNDRITDASQEAIDRDYAEAIRFLGRFEAIDTTGFPEQEILNKTLMVEQLRNRIEDQEYREWEMPVNQMFGAHIDTPQIVDLLDFTTVKDYDEYIARLRQYPRLFDQTIGHMRKGIEHGLMPPGFLLEKVATQSASIITATPETSPYAKPLEKLPKSFPEAEQKRIREELLSAIRDSINPAYQSFTAFVKDEYAPRGRNDVGLWSLPDGTRRYAKNVRRQTTTSLRPENIHQIGVREVARIEKEMLVIARKQGSKDLKSFNAAIDKNRDLRAKSRQNMLELYRMHIDNMQAKLPQLFGRLPKAKVEVMQVEEYREKEASGAQYQQGTPDGSRPGHVMVNTSDFQSRKSINIESTAYHEGVPGHHLQISIAQELPTLPPFRQQGGYTSYVEGWALYSERLGKEVGFYRDPYSDYGRLQDEMLRAIRLVVDTGLHDKKWSRDQVVKYFHDHSAIDEVEVQAETDRYIVMPGQALGYKIGQLKILELREKSKKALGPKFDIREFHDEILGAGALPMNVLEQRIGKWIAAKKKA